MASWETSATLNNVTPNMGEENDYSGPIDNDSFYDTSASSILFLFSHQVKIKKDIIKDAKKMKSKDFLNTNPLV